MMQWLSDRARGSKAAGQFSTPDWLAELLCSRLIKNPRHAVDLGIGKGALALALARRYPTAKIFGVDNFAIPRSSRNEMKRQGITLSKSDVSLSEFSTFFYKRYGQMDTIVSNPPFISIAGGSEAKELLRNSLMMTGGEKQRLDLIFLAHAMKMLKPGGEAAFILPVSAFSMSRTLSNLETMVQNFGLVELIKLPNDLFEQAEVETAVLIFRPGHQVKERDHFVVHEASLGGLLNTIGTFSVRALVEYFAPSNEILASPNSLGALGGIVTRGRHSSRKLLREGVTHFHTTSFQRYPSAQVIFDGTSEEKAGYLDAPAMAGDILIPRVGTRCLGRAAIVVEGRSHISDCVFRISTPTSKRRQVWEFLSSEAGSAWQLSMARGACAKFITQQDLLRMPLPISVK
jgi:tRNA1(Val) A37 N6-methylase TrmN6